MTEDSEYSLYKAFVGYVSMIEHFRNLDSYRKGAKVLRNCLPSVSRGEPGFRDIKTVQHFVAQVLVEDDEILTLTCEDDAAATIEALGPEAKNILMLNPVEIKEKIFMT